MSNDRPKKKTYLLAARVDFEHKEAVTRGAAAAGVSISSVVRDGAREKARELEELAEQRKARPKKSRK